MAALAGELADRVYRGADAGDLAPLFEQLSALLEREGSGEALEWLSRLEEPSPRSSARKAFLRLRYHLFADGPPRAA